MALIFSDFKVEALESDAADVPGVFIKARRGAETTFLDLAPIALTSIYTSRRRSGLTDAELAGFMALRRLRDAARPVRSLLPKSVKDVLHRKLHV
jgi:hypothetical protein